MLEIARSILDAFDHNQAVALATVIEARGPERSTSGTMPGAKLLVREDGTRVGSFGDETIDGRVVADCGKQIGEGIETKIATYAVAQGELDVYVEVMYGHPTVVIVGAGHVGWHLSRLAKMIGYSVVVVDDRPDYASPERFPDADQVIAADMAETLSSFPIGPSTYIVLVTRGHGYDHNTLSAVLDSRAAYIGMIGSRTRVGVAFSRLIEDGVPKEKLDRVYAPIGLRIGAQTPEEIALSILAEIVNVRRGGDAPASKDRLKENRDV